MPLLGWRKLVRAELVSAVSTPPALLSELCGIFRDLQNINQNSEKVHSAAAFRIVWIYVCKMSLNFPDCVFVLYIAEFSLNICIEIFFRRNLIEFCCNCKES